MSEFPTSFPVHQAAKDGNVALLKKFSKKELNRGDDEGWTPVHWAAWKGNPDTLRVILDKGGDPNATDRKGSSPLHVAAQYGNLSALDLMAKYGSNIWLLDNNGRTAAKVAALSRRAECCRYLDNLAIQWEMHNTEYVAREKKKALKDLKKRVRRMSDDKSGGKKKLSTDLTAVLSGGGGGGLATEKHGRTSSISDNPDQHSEGHGAAAAGRKKKISTQEALLQNFELRTPADSKENSESEDEEGNDLPHSVAGGFRPVPVHTGALLNTLSSLAQQPFKLEPLNVDQFTENHSESLELNSSSGSRRMKASGEAGQPLITENNSALATFLQSLDLADCNELLHREKLDIEALGLCNEQDFVSIGMALGPRKKILHALQRRKQAMAYPGAMVDSDL